MKRSKVPRGVTCPEHLKQAYPSRKLARHWARILHAGEQVSEYRCEYLGQWHIGHLPQALIEGVIDREQHREGVRMRMEKLPELRRQIRELTHELEGYRYLERQAVLAMEAITQLKNVVAMMEARIAELEKEIENCGGVHVVSGDGLPEPGEDPRE